MENYLPTADGVATAILPAMRLDIAAVQRALRDDGLDAWLLYDFHGSNPIARRVTGLNAAAKLTTRRWYYLIPADGAPRALVHAIEDDRLDHLPGDKTRYARHGELDAGLRALLIGCASVAMEFSPGCAIPYVSRATWSSGSKQSGTRRRSSPTRPPPERSMPSKTEHSTW
jgi:hypothetical protein